MMRTNRVLESVAVVGLLAMAGACAHKVDGYCNENTPCEDPARPFCDVNGQYEGSGFIGNTCIADPFPDAGNTADAAPDSSVADARTDTPPDASTSPDAGPPSGTWSTPQLVANVNGSSADFGPAISPDGLELYYARPSASEATDINIMVAKRASVTTIFSTGQPVTAVNTSGVGATEYFPFVTGDGLELYFERLGQPAEIYVSKRVTTASTWQSPTMVFPGRDPSLTDDKLEIYYRGSCPDNYPCIYRRTRSSASGTWSSAEMVPLPPGVQGDGSASMNFQFVHVSPDGLGLLLSAPISASASQVVQVWRPNRSSDWSSSAILVISSLASERTNSAARWNHDLTEIYLDAHPGTGSSDGTDIYVSRLQ